MRRALLSLLFSDLKFVGGQGLPLDVICHSDFHDTPQHIYDTSPRLVYGPWEEQTSRIMSVLSMTISVRVPAQQVGTAVEEKVVGKLEIQRHAALYVLCSSAHISGQHQFSMIF